jgi:hypothetical protein
MYRVPAIAVLLAAAALPPSLEGQMRAVQRPNVSGRISVGPHFRPMQPPPGGFRMVMPGPLGRRGVFVRTGVFPNHFRFSVFFGNSCFTDPFFDPFFCQQFFFRNRFLFARPVFLPYPVYTAPYSQVVEQTPSTVTDRGSDLARELERLTDEVERLREEQAAREQARLTPPPRRPSAEENVPITILVFRDGHRSEVRNYAIVGQTLWVFTEQRARKIPVSDLDVEATKKVNSDRGVEIPLP